MAELKYTQHRDSPRGMEMQVHPLRGSFFCKCD